MAVNPSRVARSVGAPDAVAHEPKPATAAVTESEPAGSEDAVRVEVSEVLLAVPAPRLAGVPPGVVA